MSKSNRLIIFCVSLLVLNVTVTFSRNSLTDNKFIGWLLKDTVNYAKYNGDAQQHKTEPKHRVTTYDLIKEAGYVAETHIVSTEDRYLLTVYRIPGVNAEKPQVNKPVIILQHGILCSSSFWLLNGNNSLGFLLANEGFDVWLPNSRGNVYSRQHEFLDPDKNASQFWDFSFHEMGYYDMPAVIDYILAATSQQQIYFIGHSMATTISIVLSSTRPEYNSKIKAILNLAPVAYFGRAQSLLQIFSEYVEPPILNHAVNNNFYELFPSNKWIDLLSTICMSHTFTSAMCEETFGRLIDFDPSQTRKGFLYTFLQHFPAGSSVKAKQHLNQLLKVRKFQQFDYGYKGNYKRYRHAFPPQYPQQNAIAPILMFFANDDSLSTEQEVNELYNNLPNVEAKIVMKYKKFNHLDFLFAKDAKALFYDDLIEIIKRYHDVGHVDYEFLKQFKTLLVT